MGGHKAGDIASEMAVLQLGNEWKSTKFETKQETIDWLDKQINYENERIYHVSNKYDDLNGMGTTMVIAVFINKEIIVGNIGDSRGYQLTADALQLVTEDHSFANELRLSGEITEEEAKIHHQKNTLTRSLGVFDKVNVDFFTLEEEDTRLVMLCSDGLSNGLEDDEIECVLSADTSLEQKGTILIDKALENGSTDNVTVCLIDPTDTSKIHIPREEEK